MTIENPCARIPAVVCSAPEEGVSWRTVVAAVMLLALGGCVAMPVVDSSKLGSPRSVAIVDIPDVKPQALIGILVPHAPGPNQFHFSERGDTFFAVPGQ